MAITPRAGRQRYRAMSFRLDSAGHLMSAIFKMLRLMRALLGDDGFASDARASACALATWAHAQVESPGFKALLITLMLAGG